MKLIILSLCVAAAFAASNKRCYSSDECDEGQCCVNFLLVSNFGGYCYDLRKEGESCTPLSKVGEEEDSNMYHYICPCVGGLECKATHEIEIFGHVIKHRPECIKPGSTDGGIDIGEPDAE